MESGWRPDARWRSFSPAARRRGALGVSGGSAPAQPRRQRPEASVARAAVRACSRFLASRARRDGANVVYSLQLGRGVSRMQEGFSSFCSRTSRRAPRPDTCSRCPGAPFGKLSPLEVSAMYIA